MLVGYRDGFLRCFDTINAKAQLWDVSQAHRGAVTAIYADQNYILTGGQDGAVRVWNRRTRQLLIQFNGKLVPLVAASHAVSRLCCFLACNE